MMSEEQKNKALVIRTMKMLFDNGFDKREIFEILMDTTSAALWKKMSPKQRAQYANDFEQFRRHNIENMPKL